MRTLARLLILAGSLLVTSGALEAQRVGGGGRPVRPQLRRGMTDPARRQAMRERIQSLTPQQRSVLRQRMVAARAERRQLAQGLRSGQLTRPQARVQLREWQRANRMPGLRPGLRRPFKP